MKKRSGDIPENGLNDVVILLHSEGNLKKKGFGDILEKSLNDALIHLRKVLNGEITERNYKPPPKTIQRLIAEEVFRELSDVDFDAVGNLHREIRRVESKMRDPAKQIVLAIKERGKHKKNKHLELARIYIQQLDSHIVFHHDELEHYKDSYQKLVKTLNETEAEIEKEISFRLKTCNKDIKENCVLGDVRHRVEAGTKGKIK